MQIGSAVVELVAVEELDPEPIAWGRANDRAVEIDNAAPAMMSLAPNHIAGWSEAPVESIKAVSIHRIDESHDPNAVIALDRDTCHVVLPY